ncbi:MAG: sugar phosphate nucleotidyltransferase [Bacteroidales bacterium]
MKAVILAGGLGSRLKPFTDVIPKPLLPLGEKSLLEHQIEHLKDCNFNEIFIAVNYMADYIQSYLGDGKKHNVSIKYSIEDKPLGTCGPVTLLKEQLTEPFLLINGDILTKTKLNEIYDFAVKYPDSFFTAATKIITTPFRFSNIKSDGAYIVDVEEKPDLHFEILAGIYILKPSIFQIIPENKFYGIDDLIKDMLKLNFPITKYLIKDYWVDIGVVEDYEKAREIYDEHFKTA